MQPTSYMEANRILLVVSRVEAVPGRPTKTDSTLPRVDYHNSEDFIEGNVFIWNVPLLKVLMLYYIFLDTNHSLKTCGSPEYLTSTTFYEV